MAILETGESPTPSRRLLKALLGAAGVVIVAGMSAQDAAAQSQPIIYPSGGQSRAQQALDESECRGWAQQQTGFDPFAWGPGAPGSLATGDIVGGAAGGAALGAVGGAIGGSAGRGAAIGAGVGAAAGLLRRGNREQQQRADQRNQAAAFDRSVGEFNRAFATCMRGRGYTVS